VIIAEVFPTQLLNYYVSMRNRVDSFEVFSLGSEAEQLRNFVQKATEAMERGVWMCILISTTDRGALSCLSNIIDALCDKGGIPGSFRLIVFASPNVKLPYRLLAQANVFNFHGFPPIRQEMLGLYARHAASIRSGVNPKLMKMLTYAIALIAGIINFRNTMKPLGFTAEVNIGEMQVREAIDELRSMIDSRPAGEELPIRNLRDLVQDLLFGPAVLDTFDRRKVRSTVYSILTPDVTSEGFSFVDAISDEGETWLIPGDVPTATCQHIIERMPAFPTCDVLLMSRESSLVIRNWNLSQMLVKPFLSFVAKDKVLYQERAVRAKAISVLLPKLVDIKRIPTGPVTLFLCGEIERFNRAMFLIRRSLASCEEKVLESIAHGQTPHKWKELIGNASILDVKNFVKLLREKEAFYHSFQTHLKLPLTLDANWIWDIRGLLYAYLHQCAIDRGLIADNLVYEFSFSKEIPDDCLALENVYLIGGVWERGLDRPRGSIISFAKMEPMVMTVVQRAMRPMKSFLCPMFRSVPMKEYALESDVERVDGEVGSFVWYVPLRAKGIDKHLVSEGTCLICHMPEVFK
jgi:hypothetical protein